MYISIAIFAYFLNAGVYVADKYLLSKKIHSSAVYAFYVGIWSIFNAVILIFAPWVPNLGQLILDLSAGALFLITLVFWYKALHQSEATRVVPIVGALVPIFSLTLSWLFLHEPLSRNDLLSFAFLIVGGILISIKYTKFYVVKQSWNKVTEIFGQVLGKIHAEYHPTRRLLINSVVSAALFGAYYVLIKYIYLHQPFIGGFVWSRFGTFILALLILFIPSWRQPILETRREGQSPKKLAFFLLIRLLAAAAFILINYAISLGHVAVVNALQGVQYIFLLLLVLVFSAKFPKILNEELGRGVIIQKILGTILIGIGLYLLVI